MKNVFWYGVVLAGGIFLGAQYVAPILPQLNDTVNAITTAGGDIKSSLPKIK